MRHICLVLLAAFAITGCATTSSSSAEVAALTSTASPMSTAADPATGPLAYSHASATEVQPQPEARSCHETGHGLYVQPDPKCTPGALNPAVTQATIDQTICSPGWAAKVRPAEDITEPEKRASMTAYGLHGSARPYEYDHLVPLELGGAPNDPRNLWPEPNYPGVSSSSFHLNPKDYVEDTLNTQVCEHKISLAQAQIINARHWVAYAKQHGW